MAQIIATSSCRFFAGNFAFTVSTSGALAITVTGATPELFAALLRAGLRLDGFPALLCWDRPFADLERYCLASYALP